MTADTQRAEWLAARSKGIGGSEITAVLGLSPYETPFSLWERKTGRRPSMGDNKFTRAGNYLEDAVAQMFADATGLEVYMPGEKRHFRHPEHEFLLGTPDRFVSQKHGDGVLEIKTTQKRIDKADIPLNWFFQVQWYMGITGMKTGYIAWLSSGVDFDHVQVSFDAGMFDDMVSQACDFWQNNVLLDIAPAAINRDDIMKIIGMSKPEAVEAADDAVALHEKIKANKAKIRELEESNDEMIEMIQLAMMEKEAMTWRGSTLFTWKPQCRETIDTKALQAADPDAFADLMRQYGKKTTTRVFLVK